MSRLRVEEPKASPAPEPVKAVTVDLSAEEWRKLAQETGSRLMNTQKTVEDLRKTANELRARLEKSQSRLSSAQMLNDQMQATVVTLTAERDDARASSRPIEELRRAMWDVLEDAQRRLLE